MPLLIVRNDITKMQVDAIVNAANNSLLGGGGVDGCIHRAAGPELLAECRTLNGCETGKAKVTAGYHLPARYVIHTVGPVWRGGMYGEELLLRSCYRESLALAHECGCETVAFPLISAGVYGYPKDQALKIAMDEIDSFLRNHDMQVYVVIFDKKSFSISQKLLDDIEQFIDDRYVDLHTDSCMERSRRLQVEMLWEKQDRVSKAPKYMPEYPAKCAPVECDAECESFEIEEVSYAFAKPAEKKSLSLDSMLNAIDESFSQMLLRKIDESGMTDAQCYKKANIDRKLFSKIKNDIHYKTSKTTVIAFALALELSLEETREMLMKAGYALSHSNKFDIIIEYFIMKGNYNILEINEVLFNFDQVLLGV